MQKSAHASRKAFRLSALYSLVRETITSWNEGRQESSSRLAAALPRQTLILESLEPRLLLSADPVTLFAGGVLSATLTDQADSVVITQTGTSADGGVIINLTLNGALASYGDSAAGVKSLTIQGLAGDDQFKLNSSIGATLSIDGGEGLDTLSAANMANTWALTAVGAGNVNGGAFTGFENLIGGNAGDVFKINAGSGLSGLRISLRSAIYSFPHCK